MNEEPRVILEKRSGDVPPEKPRRRWFRWIILTFMLLTVVAIGCGIGIYRIYEKQLPDIDWYKYAPSLNTRVFDRNNKLIAEFHAEENRRERVPLERIPEFLQQAVIATEDGRFYSHYGVDPLRVAGTIWRWIKSRRIRGGFSTITMQLARNAFLTLDQTVDRKMKEIILTMKLEQRFTKQEILELYLNEINFGHGGWGISSAADIYFGKKTEDLNLAECSVLAGVLNIPNYYDLYKNMEAARKRQKIVLDRMMANGFINETQAREAAEAELQLAGERPRKQSGSYFVEHVRRFLLENFSAREVYTRGLQVYTTLDAEYQTAAEEAIKNAEVFKDAPLSEKPKLQGGFVAIEPGTGRILAMVGGRDYKHSEFNRVTQARRQPGSSFKPIVYLEAIARGTLPNRVMIDEPLEIRTGNKVWRPKNYGNRYLGPLTVKEALMRSLNSIAVQLIQEVTPANVAERAARMGYNRKPPPYPSIALGASEATLLEMATVYGTICNQGIRVDPIAVLSVQDSRGNLLWKAPFSAERVADPVECRILIDMMEAVIRSGTGTRARINRPAAGKTGTTNDSIDAWFCGFTPHLVACTYVGNDDSVPLGARAAAGTISAPIWKDFMNRVLKDTPPEPFPVPAGVVFRDICLDSGCLASPDCDRHEAMAFPAGAEPMERCSGHEGLASGVSGDDSSELVLYTPTRVMEVSGFDDPGVENQHQNNQLHPPRKDEQDRDRAEFFRRRSRFQNPHNN